MSMCSQRPAQLKGFLYTRRSATREIGELLESLGHNPIEAMVQMATDPEASLELRGRMNAEVGTMSIRSAKRLKSRATPNKRC